MNLLQVHLEERERERVNSAFKWTVDSIGQFVDDTMSHMRKRRGVNDSESERRNDSLRLAFHSSIEPSVAKYRNTFDTLFSMYLRLPLTREVRFIGTKEMPTNIQTLPCQVDAYQVTKAIYSSSVCVCAFSLLSSEMRSFKCTFAILFASLHLHKVFLLLLYRASTSMMYEESFFSLLFFLFFT